MRKTLCDFGKLITFSLNDLQFYEPTLHCCFQDLDIQGLLRDAHLPPGEGRGPHCRQEVCRAPGTDLSQVFKCQCFYLTFGFATKLSINFNQDQKISYLTKTPSTEEELPVRGVRRRRTPAVQHRQPR